MRFSRLILQKKERRKKIIVFVSRDSDVISGQRNERKTFINLEDVDELGVSMKKKNTRKNTAAYKLNGVKINGR